MKYFGLNINKKLARNFLLLITFFAVACNPTKYVPSGESLLDRTYIEVNTSDISRRELTGYIRQKPNKRIFGARFHLGLYNLSNIEKDKWPHAWLRNIGEEPVIFDPLSTNRSKEQLKSYLGSKGYFDADVLETIETARKRSKVYYNVDVRTPYTVRNLKYEIADSLIRIVVFIDSGSCVVSRNKPYDLDKLIEERARIERTVRDWGYYNFSSDYVNILVDSTIGRRQVDITIRIDNSLSADGSGELSRVPHSRYRVRNIYIFPEFSPGEAVASSSAYYSSLDTLQYKDYYFITHRGKPRINYDLILQTLSVRPNSVFNVSNSERSHKQLNALKTYRLININYQEPPQGPSSGSEFRSIDGVIQLTPFDQQSFTVELEGTNSSGNYGAAVNLIYQHKNLFHGAQQFNFKLKGAYETLSEVETGFRNTQEFGMEANLQFPEFLLPFLKKENFIRKYNPKSYLRLAYNYQKIPVYSRTVANATFGYNWSSGRFNTHMLYPFQMNLVNLPYIDPAFALRIDTSSYLSYSYKDMLIIGGSYTYVFNNQIIQRSRDHVYFKFNIEAAGNLASLANRLAGQPVTDEPFKLLGQEFAQFVRTDVDLRYNRVISDVSTIVYRGFVGAGIPYGNSKALPFEKQYFGGGANGVRGWQVRSLGPGSFYDEVPSFVNQTADIKLELNAEYRFKLFWILEGAVFIDAGNIWTIKDDPDRPGAVFRFDRFIDDIAVGSGFGMRFDLNFVLLRADLGFKLRDPALQGDTKWIRLTRQYNFRDDFAFVFGIGYPF